MKKVFLLISLLLPSLALAAPSSPYIPSSMGYDVTFTTYAFPAESFGFAVVGVTGGKSFVENKRLPQGVAWARFASHTAATAYMNLNAPYGKTVKGHIQDPKECPPADDTKVGSTTEPTACQGYNYGYQAAQHAYAYAQSKGLDTRLWWLDIEEANSWSKDIKVNMATIQGAIDYLNAQDIRVGVYSVMRMWRDIVGVGFVPKQSLGGQPVPVATWLPVGVKNQVKATNACVTGASFMPGSPIWIVQYEASSTAVDQNIAC